MSKRILTQIGYGDNIRSDLNEMDKETIVCYKIYAHKYSGGYAVIIPDDAFFEGL